MTANRNASAADRHPDQWSALAVGVVFLLVGVTGFLVTGFDGFADPDGELLLGFFEINPLHNVVHLLIGATGVALWQPLARARTEVRGGALSKVVEADLDRFPSVRNSSARLVSADHPSVDAKVTTALSCGVVERLDHPLGRSDVRMRIRIGFVGAPRAGRSRGGVPASQAPPSDDGSARVWRRRPVNVRLLLNAAEPSPDIIVAEVAEPPLRS
jgi:hypothetical protein